MRTGHRALVRHAPCQHLRFESDFSASAEEDASPLYCACKQEFICCCVFELRLCALLFHTHLSTAGPGISEREWTAGTYALDSMGSRQAAPLASSVCENSAPIIFLVPTSLSPCVAPGRRLVHRGGVGRPPFAPISTHLHQPPCTHETGCFICRSSPGLMHAWLDSCMQSLLRSSCPLFTAFFTRRPVLHHDDGLQLHSCLTTKSSPSPNSNASTPHTTAM